MVERNSCFICEDCNGCFKHNICPTIKKYKKCSGNFDITCKGNKRKYKSGIELNRSRDQEGGEVE